VATERTRDRITGGVLLIALAIITLPMLFDGSGIESPVAPMLPVVPPAAAPHVAPLGSNDLATADALRARVDADGIDSGSSTRLGDPVLAPAERPGVGLLPQVWGIQVASFSARGNAVALRDQLRGDGYQAVLSEVKGLTGISTRVAIGPMVDRADALRLELELEKRYGMDAIVVLFGQ
jgi:cell division septation protein DedD